MVTTMSETQALETKSRSYDPAATPFTATIPLTSGKTRSGVALPPGTGTPPDELDLFHDFSTRHLRTVANSDVQCMLVWAEWVRYYLKQTKNFPRLILEDEFNYLITGLFATRIALDEHRGRIYPGIRFAP